ncbi:MAG: hypothetical protein JW742_01225 [Candidatus Aminicenantes bacterium]|nr:hypothetical protein [Candidatus Aminicenantes bacterium]
MRGFFAVAALIGGVFAGGPPGLQAKDCPSRLPSNLHAIASTDFSWALELRGFSYLVGSRSYLFPAAGALLRFEPSDAFSVDVEGVFRDKTFTDCSKAGDLPPVQVRTLALFYAPGGGALSFRLGRQEVRLGNGLVLDDFFDAAVVEYSGGGWNLSAGGGLLAIGAARETQACQKGFFFEYKSCWKGTCGAGYGDFGLAFASLSRRFGGGLRIGLLYERVVAETDTYASDVVSLFGQARLPLGFTLFGEAAVQRRPFPDLLAFGWHLQAVRAWRISGLGTLQAVLHSLYGSDGERGAFLPTFGTVTLAERMHYSARQGLSWGAALSLTPAFSKRLTLEAGYFSNSGARLDALLSEEFDFGLTAKPLGSDLLRLTVKAAFARTLHGSVHQLRAETRVTF